MFQKTHTKKNSTHKKKPKKKHVEGEEMFIESCRIRMHPNRNIAAKAQELHQFFLEKLK
jgi:NRPS condensation-like uncharacterized protein